MGKNQGCWYKENLESERTASLFSNTKFPMIFDKKDLWGGPESWMAGSSSHEKFSLPSKTFSTNLFF